MVARKALACAVSVLSVCGALAAGSAQAQPACRDRIPTDPITLNLREANLATTLRLLAQQFRVNVLVTDEVAGAVTLDFFQVPARDVFQALVDAGALRCAVADNVLRVSSAARVQKEEDERAKAADARRRADAEAQKSLIEARQREAEFERGRARGPVREVSIRLFYADAEEVARTLQGILGLPVEGAPAQPPPGIYAPAPPVTIGDVPRPPAPVAAAPAPVPTGEALVQGLTIKAHKPTNSVFIRYYERDLERIVALVKETLDVPLPQIQIAAQMVLTTQSALEQLGVQWGGAFLIRTNGDSGPALLGTGFSQPNTGVPSNLSDPSVQPVGGTGVNRPTANPAFTGTGLLPVSPVTGLPVGGNIVNLPTALLPTAANPAFGALFGIVGDNFNISLAIQALEVQGKAKALAEPKVVTVENSKATIKRGFEVPYLSQSGFGGTQVQFKEAVLQLSVTPNVIRENGTTKIRMKVLVENSEPDFSRAVLGNPPIFTRRADAEVVVKEGERLVIGGIIGERTDTTVRKVPWLGDLPVLGWLFKSREISSSGEELIVIIAPSVVTRPEAATKR
jgi:type IV pilus assembly protein PilQ